MILLKIVVVLYALGSSIAATADSYSNVIVNGQRLTWGQLNNTERQLGFQVAPGNYLYNAYNQCWANLTTGQSGCLGGNRASGSGSGEWDGQGNWSSWSDYGGGVGGTADGCIYTSNWSNC